MDYKPLITQAIKRNGWTRYKLAQVLGYKRVSGIYEVEKGRTGLSAEKYHRLLTLAGKSLLVLLTSTALTLPSHEVQAAAKLTEQRLIIETLYIM